MTRLVRDWQQDAACLDVGFAGFTPEGDADAGETYRGARRICAGCPVRSDCLEFALAEEGSSATSDRVGVFGGLGPRERHKLHLQRRRAAKQAAA